MCFLRIESNSDFIVRASLREVGPRWCWRELWASDKRVATVLCYRWLTGHIYISSYRSGTRLVLNRHTLMFFCYRSNVMFSVCSRRMIFSFNHNQNRKWIAFSAAPAKCNFFNLCYKHCQCCISAQWVQARVVLGVVGHEIIGINRWPALATRLSVHVI
jgi:hypothetical protein